MAKKSGASSFMVPFPKGGLRADQAECQFLRLCESGSKHAPQVTSQGGPRGRDPAAPWRSGGLVGQLGWGKGMRKTPRQQKHLRCQGRISPEVTVRSYGPKSLRQVVCCGRVGWGQRLLGPGCFVWSGSRRGGRTDSPQPHSLKPPAPLLALDEEVVEVWWGWWGLL